MSDHKTPVHIRWWIRRDNPQVLAIDQLTSDYPLTENDLLCFLKDRDTVGMVAEKGDAILGFMVYELYKRSIHLLCLAVHPDWQKQDIGKQLIYKLSQKLSLDRRRCITVNVRERNLLLQQYLRHLGFKCISVHRNWFFDSNEDSFLFCLDYETTQKWSVHTDLKQKNAESEGLSSKSEGFEAV